MFKMPVSGTHTAVGAFLGAGLIVHKLETLNWAKLGTILASWIISPLMSAFICFLCLMAVSSLTMNTSKFAFTTRLYAMQLISGIFFLILSVLLNALIEKKDKDDSNMINIIIPIVSFFVGVIIARITFLIKIWETT